MARVGCQAVHGSEAVPCRCPTLLPLGLHIWQQAVPALHAVGGRSALVAHLSHVAMLGGAGGACACLLGNLAQIAGPGLKV